MALAEKYQQVHPSERLMIAVSGIPGSGEFYFPLRHDCVTFGLLNFGMVVHTFDCIRSSSFNFL